MIKKLLLCLLFLTLGSSTICDAALRFRGASSLTGGATGDLDALIASGAITAFADAGGGNVTVTSAAHGLTSVSGKELTILISGTTNYNGTFTLVTGSATTNTFDITTTWVSDDATGTWTSNGDKASVWVSGTVYEYWFDGTASDAENDPLIIRPDNFVAAGSVGVWKLQSHVSNGTFQVGAGIDGIGAVDMDYGSADITDHTFTTDGTGTAEIVLPTDSIDSTEILDNTISNSDMADNSIDSDDYVDGSIDLAHMSSNSVDSDNIVDNEIIEPDLSADNAPSDGDVLTYDSTGTNFAWITPNAGTDITADLEEESHGSEHDGTDGDYVTDSGDTMTGTLDMNDGVTDSPVISFTPQTGTAWSILSTDSDDDLEIRSASTASVENIDLTNPGAGTVSLTVDGTISGSNLSGTNTGDDDVPDDNTELPDMAQNTIKMRVASGTGDPEDIDISAGLSTVTGVSGDFVIIEDATDGNLKKVDVGDFLGGGVTYDAIGDAAAAGSISFDDTETATYASAEDGGTFFNINSTVADIIANTVMFQITALDNDDINYIPLRIADDSGVGDDTLFQIDYTGAITTGTIAAGSVTGTHSGTDITADLEEEVTEGSLADDTIVEADLKVVNASTDEDILTKEDTTGDFEWHSASELGIGVATSITDGLIIEADLNADEAPTDNDILTYDLTGANFSWQTPAELGLLTSETNNLETDDPPNVADTEIYIGNGAGSGTWNVISGDASMSNGGVLTLSANSVDSAEYTDASIDPEHLADNTYGVVTKSTATSYTVGTTDSQESYGGVVYVTGASTITLPAIVARMAVTVITIGAVAVSVDTNASDRMYLDGTALDDGDKATNTSTTGDSIVCVYESAAGWYCMSGSPDGDNWTDGGP